MKFRPEILSPSIANEKERIDQLMNNSSIESLDLFINLKAELFKLRSPSEKKSDEEWIRIANKKYQENEIRNSGDWVFYPWLNKIIHLVSKDDFIEIRTSRNKYKITQLEQDLLSTKTIGVVGLSVGNSVAISLAIERVCGKLLIADFDVLELSNMNRIRTGIQNIGLPKTIITAREISEIDPFIEVEIFTEGLTKNNIESFISCLDVLVDECDSLDMKIQMRQAAKSLRIPVLMDTSDRGMLDIERYDTEPDRDLFHGRINKIDLSDFNSLSQEEKVHATMQIVDFDNLSDRMKTSFSQIGKTIGTWPQLASDVLAGGAHTSELCRKILLGENVPSGRIYMELDGMLSKLFDKSSVI